MDVELLSIHFFFISILFFGFNTLFLVSADFNVCVSVASLNLCAAFHKLWNVCCYIKQPSSANYECGSFENTSINKSKRGYYESRNQEAD